MQQSNQMKFNEAQIAFFFCISALWIFFLSDAISKILLYLQYDFTRFSLFIRAFYEVLFLGVIMLFLDKNRLIFLLIIFATFLLFMLGQITFFLNFNLDQNFIEGILSFNKYFFVFITYFALYRMQTSNTLVKIAKHLELIFLINSLAVIFGFMFNVDLLRTYTDNSYRFGYSGSIPWQNEATLFTLLSVTYFYYKHFIQGYKEKKFYLVLLAGLLLGTKGIYLFLALLLLFHFFNNSGLRARMAGIVLIVTTYFGVLWFVTSSFFKDTLAYFESKAEIHGVWYMLFSGRNSFLSEAKLKILDHWTIVNYFFGGQDQMKFMTEMDFFDLFFFLGLFGFVMYFVLYFATIFKFSILKPFNFFFIFSYFLIAFFGGHFFASAVNALYLCVISMYFFVTQRHIQQGHAKDFTNQ